MKQRQLKLAAQHAARQVSNGVFISELNFCLFLHECVLKQMCIKHCIYSILSRVLLKQSTCKPFGWD